jgi:hypothetical protein
MARRDQLFESYLAHPYSIAHEIDALSAVVTLNQRA